MRPREVLQKTCSGQGAGRSSLGDTYEGVASLPSPCGRLAYSIKRGHTCSVRTRRTRAHGIIRPATTPLCQYNTLRLDLDYLESTCNAHIRSATEDGFHITMAGTCWSGLRRDPQGDYDPKKT